MDKYGLKKNENQEMTNIKDFYGVKQHLEKQNLID